MKSTAAIQIRQDALSACGKLPIMYKIYAYLCIHIIDASRKIKRQRPRWYAPKTLLWKPATTPSSLTLPEAPATSFFHLIGSLSQTTLFGYYHSYLRLTLGYILGRLRGVILPGRARITSLILPDKSLRPLEITYRVLRIILITITLLFNQILRIILEYILIQQCFDLIEV